MRRAQQQSRAADEPSPLPLRILHALVFLGVFVPAAIGVTVPELEHLSRSLTRPYHFGPPPQPLALVGALLAAVSAAVILSFFVRKRSVPLWVSMLCVAALGLSLLGMKQSEPRRSHLAPNLDILAAGRQLHRMAVDELQQTGAVPADAAGWNAYLQKLQLPASDLRSRGFGKVPFTVAVVKDPKPVLKDAPAGQLAVYVNPDRTLFEVHPVGFREDWRTDVLLDDTGSPLVLKGLFNPEVDGEKLLYPGE